ncbi:DUF945 family protein [Desulfurispira natronophila]|uniref:Uncharacterized protein YdgA (DUF945 family) n=1 Tax=Desulfurispira natronophila TaxID=682562 RepID=A0A7W8DHA6_9BACT|nr:DUF945 family protein [Desulfurispira natronophila]MBB5022083.1 uncharacterized protein YdgA (DUF945 family) [Desulfurispira natronophila]
MNRTTSILLIILACGALIAAAVPAIAGHIFHSLYKQTVEQANERSDLRVTSLEYQRGWLSSHALSRIEVVTSAAGAKTLSKPFHTLEIEHQIHHGFGSILSHNTVFLGGTDEPQWLFQSDLPIEFSTVSNWSGDTDIQLRMPPIATEYVVQGQPNQLFSSELTATLSLKDDFKKVEGKGSLAHVQWHMDQGQIELTGLAYELEQQQLIHYLHHGTQHFSLETLHTDIEGSRLWLNDIDLISAVRPDDDNHNLVNLTLNARVGQGLTDNLNLGPLELAMGLQGIDAAALDKLIEITGQGAGQTLDQQELLNHIRRTLTPDSRLEISYLSAGTERGAVEAYGVVSMVPDSATLHSMNYLDELQANFTIKVPQALSTHLDIQQQILLQALVAQGVIELKNHHYILNLQLEQGVLFLNGKALPLAALLGQW